MTQLGPEPVTLSVGVLCFSHMRAEWLASARHGQSGVCTSGSPGSAKTDAKCAVTSVQSERWSVTQEDVSSRYHTWLSGARAATGLRPRAVGTAGSGVLSHSSWASRRWDVGKRQSWAAARRPETSGATKQSNVSYKATEKFSSLPLTFFNKLPLPLGISS